MNPIGVHFIPTHQGKFHYDFIRDMQPGIFKLVGSSTPDVQQLADGYAAAPNALIYVRNVARSEQHDFLWREPVRAAKQHVQEWHADIDRWYQQARERGLTLPPVEQLRILGVNEPVIELFPRQEDMSNYDQWLSMMNERTPILDAYMVEFGYEANRLGYGAGLGNLSSGQPANLKPGSYPTFDWFPKTRKLLESTRGKNAYTCHEYWRAETGPEGHAGWHAWRFMHLNVDCDIDILESGVDQYITGEDPHGNRGWKGHMEAPAYVDQHRRYIERARKDSRYRCSTPFTLDGDKMWESFYIEPCMPEMIALSSHLRASQPPTPSTPPGGNVFLPGVGTGAPAPVPGQPVTMYITATAGAKLRDEPETGKVIGLMPWGSHVTLLDNEPGAEWQRVRFWQTEGWVRADLIGDTKPVPKPQPPTPAPSDNFERALPHILKWEGGWADDPNDPGGATMKGITIGTYTRWRKEHGLPAPTKEDLRNISDDEVRQIYREWYWDASQANTLPWPLALAHMDTAVNAGVGKAQEMLQKSGGNFLAYMGHLIDWYARIDGFQHFGRAWMRRRADLLKEAAK